MDGASRAIRSAAGALGNPARAEIGETTGETIGQAVGRAVGTLAGGSAGGYFGQVFGSEIGGRLGETAANRYQVMHTWADQLRQDMSKTPDERSAESTSFRVMSLSKKKKFANISHAFSP